MKLTDVLRSAADFLTGIPESWLRTKKDIQNKPENISELSKEFADPMKGKYSDKPIKDLRNFTKALHGLIATIDKAVIVPENPPFKRQEVMAKKHGLLQKLRDLMNKKELTATEQKGIIEDAKKLESKEDILVPIAHLFTEVYPEETYRPRYKRMADILRKLAHSLN